jgi:hypothetical protein
MDVAAQQTRGIIPRVQPGDPLELDTVPATGHDFRTPPLTILLICDTRFPASVVQDHIGALQNYSRHHIFPVNPIRATRAPPSLAAFDAIIVHYSILSIDDHDLPPAYRAAIRSFPGLKIQFIQDEYRRINRITARMRELGTQILFSALRPPTARVVYCEKSGLEDVFIFCTLSGYLPEDLLKIDVPPISGRPFHATYRGRTVPYWLGRHARQKHEIASGFSQLANERGLQVNVTTRDTERVYGRDWINLVLSGKAILGTEGGASIFDFDGQVERLTGEYLRLHPHAGFDEVFENVLGPFEGNVVHRAFTPRLLEAIALRTALVLFPGEYAGILKPWKHYVPLNRDFSNSEEVAIALRDDRLLQKMVDRAFQEIACSPEFSYRRFVSRFDVAVDLAMQNMHDIALHASHRPAGAARDAALRARLALHELPGRARRLLEHGRRHVAGVVPASVRRFLRRRRFDYR